MGADGLFPPDAGSPRDAGSPQPFTFFLPASPDSFTATSASPAVFTAAGSSYANGTPVVLTGSPPPGGFAGAGGLHLAAVQDAEYEPVMLFIDHFREPNVSFAAPRSAASTGSGQSCSASTATTSLLISCTG